MIAPSAKGILVYADGRTEPCEVIGRTIVKGCDRCGGQAVFEAVERMAEDANTVNDKLVTLARDNRAFLEGKNGGTVVYIQRRKL